MPQRASQRLPAGTRDVHRRRELLELALLLPESYPRFLQQVPAHKHSCHGGELGCVKTLSKVFQWYEQMNLPISTHPM